MEESPINNFTSTLVRRFIACCEEEGFTRLSSQGSYSVSPQNLQRYKEVLQRLRCYAFGLSDMLEALTGDGFDVEAFDKVMYNKKQCDYCDSAHIDIDDNSSFVQCSACSTWFDMCAECRQAGKAAVCPESADLTPCNAASAANMEV